MIFFQKYTEFRSMPEVHSMEVKFLMKYNLSMSPQFLKTNPKFEFEKAIEKYEVIQDVNS